MGLGVSWVQNLWGGNEAGKAQGLECFRRNFTTCPQVRLSLHKLQHLRCPGLEPKKSIFGVVRLKVQRIGFRFRD